MTDYRPIAAQLARVRRAWKRSSALAGLAVTILETAGLFTVMVLVDLLFRPGLQGRLVLMGLVVGAVVLLLLRHVLRPLFRRLPDEQVALYVEEHNPGFDGALIAAAEFGRQPDQPGREAIVAAILSEAERRAGRLDIRSVAKLLRLRKYAWSAAAVLTVYGAAGLLFPQTVGRHAVRVMAPWKAPDVKAETGANAVAVKPDIAFDLSATNANVLRGAAFRLEATLSRDADTPVQLHFRSLGEAAAETRWYAAPMKSVEKVRGYEGVLPDINEDMECYVSAERFRSAVCRLRVYDPLAVEAVEIVTRYPAYLGLADRTDRRPNGDVAAPEGAVVTVRVLANRPLKAGRLAWGDAGPQAMTPLASEPAVAAASFTVTSNRTYRFRVEDAMGQVVESPADAYVKVLPDGPPALVLKRPVTPPESVTPLSELTLEAAVSDDFGVAGVDLVYRCGGETEGPEQRLPVMAATAGGEPLSEIAASLLLQFETLTPRLRGGEVITWFVEARDRKGQTAATDLMITPVRHLDIWAIEKWKPALDHPMEEEPPSLAAILQGAFLIASRRAQLAPRDLEKQSEDLAQTMVNEKTKAVWVFVKIEPETPKEDVPKINRINALAVEGHAALAAHRVDPAVDALRRAVMLMISMGLLEDMTLLRTPPPPSGASASPNEQQTKQQMEALAALDQQAAKEARTAEKDRKMEQANKADELQKKLANLAQEQKKNADKAAELEKTAADAAAKAAPAPEQKGARGQAAADQQKLAETVKKAAEDVAKDKELEAQQRQKTGEALRQAARHMDNAAREMKDGRLEKAAQEAADARQKLATARDELGTAGQDKLAEALAKAETLASRAKREQQAIAKETETAARAKAEAANAERVKRDLKALANRQAHVKTDLDALQETVNALKQAADSGTVRPDTAGHIQAAEQELRRGRAAQKAVNAAVALTALKPEEATPEHQKMAATLEKAQAHLQQASDGMATGHEAELKRARREAAEVTRKLKELQQPESKADGESHEGGRDVVETASRLERHVEARDFVSPEALRDLKAQVKQAQNAAGRIEEKPAQIGALAAAVGKVHAELEAAAARLQENKALFTSQREECPPQYRPLVNKYFEALSGSR